jgi:hypothetical protein
MARAANARTKTVRLRLIVERIAPVCRRRTWLSSSPSRAPRSERVVQATETVRGYCQRDLPEAAGASRPRRLAVLTRND